MKTSNLIEDLINKNKSIENCKTCSHCTIVTHKHSAGSKRVVQCNLANNPIEECAILVKNLNLLP